MSSSVVECIGYFASVLCAVSLMMKDMKKLRWLNLIASAILVAYSVINKTYPVAVTNMFIVLIDFYYIMKLSEEGDK